MSELLNVSSTPHVRDRATTQNIMRDVFIALLPATAFGVYNFGLRALVIILLSVATCVVSEGIYQKLMKKKVTVSDCSAAVTGLLLALNLPHTVPYWMPILGGVFAIIIVKQLYGGLGQNFMNPALAARCFLLISFTADMTSFTFDGVTGATPLAVLKAGGEVNLLDMIVGNIGGTIGETSVIALVLGACYLLLRNVIDITIPASYILTFVVFIVLFGGHGLDVSFLIAHLAGGGLMLGAWFMATDYVTSPITTKGRIVYGILLGILTGLFRLFGPSAEGVSYAIIIGNLFVPLIEKFVKNRPFGYEKSKGGAKS